MIWLKKHNFEKVKSFKKSWEKLSQISPKIYQNAHWFYVESNDKIKQKNWTPNYELILGKKEGVDIGEKNIASVLNSGKPNSKIKLN